MFSAWSLVLVVGFYCNDILLGKHDTKEKERESEEKDSSRVCGWVFLCNLFSLVFPRSKHNNESLFATFVYISTSTETFTNHSTFAFWEKLLKRWIKLSRGLKERKKENAKMRMTRINWFCFILFSVLFTSQQIVAAIDLARLYGHEGAGHDVQKRSGNYSLNFILWRQLLGWKATLSDQ